MRCFSFSLFAVALISFFSASAHAVRITNLDTIPYDLEVQLGGDDYRIISIEPNATWESFARPIYVKRGKNAMALEEDGEYAIWKGGALTIQRRAGTTANRGQ